MEEIFRVCAARTREQSVFVIGGIGCSKPMKALWKRLTADERIRIAFDLYDVGILFFDKTKVKQLYKIYF
jgi:ABC-type Na+ transport system ATPase subunit NatA